MYILRWFFYVVALVVGIILGAFAAPALFFFVELQLGISLPDTLLYAMLIPNFIHLTGAYVGARMAGKVFGWLRPTE